MEATQQTYQQIERALRKAATKFPADAESLPLTDLYIQVKQEGGELLIFDDNDNELTRCVVEQWIGNQDDDFYDAIQPILIEALKRCREVADNVAILKPYSYVLVGEDHETIAELHLVDDDTILISGDLMKGLNEDLDRFWEHLAAEQ